SNRALGEVARRKINSLLIPYVFFATISIPFGVALDYVMGEGFSLLNIVKNFFFLNGSVGWNSPIWFLIVLFLVDMLFLLLYKSKIPLAVSIILLFVLGFGLAITGYEYSFGLHIVTWAIVLYACGYLCKRKSVIEK